AKKNRGAACGIFAFAKGCEPEEFGDFKRRGTDFFCTVDKDALENGDPLLYIQTAYHIARAMAVAAVRKEANGKLDVQRIQEQADALKPLVVRLAEIFSKAGTAGKCIATIEEAAGEIKAELSRRLEAIFGLLQLPDDE